MRIALIEDEKRMAQALCEILRQEKYDVDHYGNGLDGLLSFTRKNRAERARRKIRSAPEYIWGSYLLLA